MTNPDLQREALISDSPFSRAVYGLDVGGVLSLSALRGDQFFSHLLCEARLHERLMAFLSPRIFAPEWNCSFMLVSFDADFSHLNCRVKNLRPGLVTLSRNPPR